MAQRTMTLTMAGGVAVALALAASSPASAGSRAVASGTDTAKVVVHGQVNRGLLTYGGAIEARPDLRIGSNIEIQFESNSTATVNQADNTAVGADNFTQRKLEVFFASTRLGTLWLGQGPTASDGSSEVDLAGTSLAGRSVVADLAGGLSFRASGTGALSARHCWPPATSGTR